MFVTICMSNILKLIVSLAAPQLTGFVSAFLTDTGNSPWYRSISKPSWNPPNWVFAPVWTLLYLLMGIAFYLVWKSEASGDVKRWAMGLWIVQLAFNFFWTIIFFGTHQIGWALIEIIGLWFLIFLTILAFSRITKIAAWLMVPYISWVTFATLLNYAIWRLN